MCELGNMELEADKSDISHSSHSLPHYAALKEDKRDDQAQGRITA